MNNKITYGITATLLLLVIMIAQASAVQYTAWKELEGNDTTQIHTIIFWDFGALTEDYVSSGNDLELAVQYSFYPKTWNERNEEYSVEYCNLTIKFASHVSNSTQTIFERTVTPTQEDISRQNYYIKLSQGDGITADAYCKFSGVRPEELEMPVEITLVTPTWECKSCQYYEWSLVERDIVKAEVIGDNTVEVWQYIKLLITLNYEIVIALFWIVLIMIGAFSTSLIFMGLYWLFLFLRRYAT